MKRRTCLKYLLVLVLTTLTWEHIGRKYESNMKPSVGLDTLAKPAVDSCKWLGRKAAWVSSYLTEIDLKEVGITVGDIAKPSIELVSAPTYTIIEYIVAAASYGNKTWMIYVGSVILVAGISWLVNKRYPNLTHRVGHNIGRLFRALGR